MIRQSKFRRLEAEQEEVVETGDYFRACPGCAQELGVRPGWVYRLPDKRPAGAPMIELGRMTDRATARIYREVTAADWLSALTLSES